MKAGLAESGSDAQRKIKAGAVKIDGQVHKDLYVQLTVGSGVAVRVGRQMKRISIS